jgi:predicted glycosyltransferase
MKIFVDIGHPAHVHFFKYFIGEMRRRGHEVLISASKKDVTLELLKAYGFNYVFTSKRYRGIGLAYELLKRDAQMFRLARSLKPEIMIGVHNMIVAQISRVTGAKSIIFTDTEHAKLANIVTFPFADVICTPSSFKKDLGNKHVRYNGYHELAYLHPDYFKPDPSVLDDLGLSNNARFAVVRFVAWGASHDIGQHGFDMQAKRKLVNELEKYARVLITSENVLPPEFEKYRITLPPEKIHDVLCYASLCVSEGGTTATEAAIMGTPSIHVSTTAQYCGIYDELHSKYGLIHTYSDGEPALQKAVELIRNEDSKKEWQHKQNKLLDDKIDVTRFMVDFIENCL